MAGKVKRKEHENLTDTNIEKVIKALAESPPITKKQACIDLNISYNPARLQKIIDAHIAQKELDKKLRDQNRGKPAQPHEIKYVIEQYLEGVPLAETAKSLYRNASFVRNIITNIGVPTRGVGETYMDYSPLPDQCVSDVFEINEIAWSSKYSAPCIIDKYVQMSADGESKVYSIYVLEPYEEPEVMYFRNVGRAGFYANQPAYELGKLDHLKQYGIDIVKRI